MKKKLLIALFMVVMACFLAFTVCAADEVTLVGGEKVDFETVFKVGKSGGVENVVTGFNTGYNSSSITDVIFPDYLAGIECNGLFGKYANPASTTIKTITFAATDEFFISGDNIFTTIPVTKITFNPNCVVELRKGNFSGCTSLTEITFPKFKKLAGSAFKGCTNMVATNDLILAEGMTEIGGHAFNGCTSLTGTVYFPSTLEKIQEYSFQNTGFTNFDLSKCENLTVVGGNNGGPFNNNDSITTLDLSGCTSLTSLKNSFAQGCDYLTKVILPPNLETIPHKAFAQCYALESIVIPASVTYIADEAFHSVRQNKAGTTFTMFLQSAVEFHATYVFRDSGNVKIEFVLLGDIVSATDFVNANTYTAITGATVVDYLDPASPWTYSVGKTLTNHTIVENYCTNLAINGEHLSDDNPCVIYCSDCKFAAAKENSQHSVSVSITYEKGYDNVGSKVTMCTNVGCGYNEKIEVKALFVCQGYSVPKEGNGGIAIGYTVNNEAIAEYTKTTGKTLKYGVFAVSKEKLGTNDIFAKNGTAAEGVISAEITKYSFVAFELKIIGFTTDTQKETKLAMGAYVAVTDGETTEYSYMQDGTPAENEKYHFVSYNDVVNLKSTTNDGVTQ